jgi:hypothetical protein
MIDPIGRRTFLALLAAMGSSAALPAFAAAGGTKELVLVDSRFTGTELAGIAAGKRSVAKAIDHHGILRWRRDLLAFLEQGGSLTAYTRWDMALLLSDLGREAGRRPRRGEANGAVEITSFEPGVRLT